MAFCLISSVRFLIKIEPHMNSGLLNPPFGGVESWDAQTVRLLCAWVVSGSSASEFNALLSKKSPSSYSSCHIYYIFDQYSSHTKPFLFSWNTYQISQILSTKTQEISDFWSQCKHTNLPSTSMKTSLSLPILTNETFLTSRTFNSPFMRHITNAVGAATILDEVTVRHT